MSRRDEEGPPGEARPEREDDAWVLDSSVPAATHLTGLPAPEEDPEEAPTELPLPIPEAAEEEVEPPPPQDEDARPRSLTIARKQMLRDRRRLLERGALPDVIEYDRPRYREQCRGGKRPCLYVACRYHLYLDVNPRTGSIKINFPDKEVHELEETCALDVAERGGVTLEEVGSIMNLTRERIRQVEASGLDKLRGDGKDLDDFLE
jgi:hypothetical protein